MTRSLREPGGLFLKSAQAFLVESLSNFTGDKLSFSIVHSVTAAELVLKERLFREHPSLVFRKARSKFTVSLREVPSRLGQAGVPLGAADEALVNEFADWRNEIVHRMPGYEPGRVQKQLPKLLDFLAGYLRRELNTPLEEFLPRELYSHATRLLSDWQNALVAARADAAATRSVATGVICPTCGGVEVVSVEANSTAKCHLCNVDLYVVESCDGCGRRMATAYEPYPGENYCDECIEAAGDEYISWYSDYIRGK